MKDTSKLLPIGSVVLLNNGTKMIMITGFYLMPANDNSKVYDYCGCLFPEGVISSEQNLLFDHKQIAKVCYMGFTSSEEKEFKTKLADIINKASEGQNAPAASPTPTEPVAPATVPTPDNSVQEMAATSAPELNAQPAPVPEVNAQPAPVPEVNTQPAPVTETLTPEGVPNNNIIQDVPMAENNAN